MLHKPHVLDEDSPEISDDENMDRLQPRPPDSDAMPEADSREDTDLTKALGHPELETEGKTEFTPAVDHPACSWVSDNGKCLGCMFQKYQHHCLTELKKGTLLQTNIGDAIAALGVFAPSFATSYMEEFFGCDVLENLDNAAPAPAPEVKIDDAALMKAIRYRLCNNLDGVAEALKEVSRDLRVMMENLLDSLPTFASDQESEFNLVASSVLPVLRPFVQINNHTAVEVSNQNSAVQKKQGIAPDRADLVGKYKKEEFLFVEVTGDAQRHNIRKNNWDSYRLARFGKARLDAGYSTAIMIQVIHRQDVVYTMDMPIRGVMLMSQVGTFVVPTDIVSIPSLIATLPTLFAVQDRVRSLTLPERPKKRSWSHADIIDAKKRILNREVTPPGGQG
ncbi:hypothetical protein BGX33_011140 [Mortierella sp. NVP41]|nr:hypothetical protein BGX33_011140 [Mortierella sp. NVP41]